MGNQSDEGEKACPVLAALSTPAPGHSRPQFPAPAVGSHTSFGPWQAHLCNGPFTGTQGSWMTGESPGRGKAGGQPHESRVLTGGGHWIFIPNCAQDSPLPDTHSLTLIPLGLHGSGEALGQNLPESESRDTGQHPPAPNHWPILLLSLAWGARDVVASLTHSQASTDLKFQDITGLWLPFCNWGQCLGVALSFCFSHSVFSSPVTRPTSASPQGLCSCPSPTSIHTTPSFTHSSCSFMSPDLPG